jgi:hypothetical protein
VKLVKKDRGFSKSVLPGLSIKITSDVLHLDGT